VLLNTIRYLRPNPDCVIVGEPANAKEYADQVEWRDDRPQPTWQQIENARSAAETAAANAAAQANRHQAFIAEADPLFFVWQRGEGTEQAWLDKCAEIRARYPYTS
jgi:hypothetical protein